MKYYIIFAICFSAYAASGLAADAYSDLHEAVAEGNLEKVKEITVSKKIKPKYADAVLAVRNERLDLLFFILEQKVNVNIKDNECMCYLFHDEVINYITNKNDGDSSILERLSSAGTDFKLFSFFSLLDINDEFRMPNKLKILDSMLSKGANHFSEWTDLNGNKGRMYILHAVIQNRNPDAFEILLKYNMDGKLKDRNGQNAFELSKRYGFREGIEQYRHLKRKVTTQQNKK